MNNAPITSFINLFPEIVYNKDENPNHILDIWDTYVISKFKEDEVRYFNRHILKNGENWITLATQYYNNSRLWWIIPLFNNVDDPFLVYDAELYNEIGPEIKVLKAEYIEDLLILARQARIKADREVNG